MTSFLGRSFLAVSFLTLSLVACDAGSTRSREHPEIFSASAEGPVVNRVYAPDTKFSEHNAQTGLPALDSADPANSLSGVLPSPIVGVAYGPQGFLDENGEMVIEPAPRWIIYYAYRFVSRDTRCWTVDTLTVVNDLSGEFGDAPETFQTTGVEAYLTVHGSEEHQSSLRTGSATFTDLDIRACPGSLNPDRDDVGNIASDTDNVVYLGVVLPQIPVDGEHFRLGIATTGGLPFHAVADDGEIAQTWHMNQSGETMPTVGFDGWATYCSEYGCPNQDPVE